MQNECRKAWKLGGCMGVVSSILLGASLSYAVDEGATYERDRTVTDGSSPSDRILPRVGQSMGEMPGIADQPEKKVMEQVSTPMSEKEKKQAQQDLAPHSLMMETLLMGALTDVKGLRAELKVNEDQVPSANFIQHFRMLGKEINDDLKVVKVHESELQGSVQKHPEIAKTSDYRSLVPSLNELYSQNASWQAKVGNNDYWKNSKNVMRDLSKIEGRINQAINKTKGFNSSQLDVSNVG